MTDTHHRQRVILVPRTWIGRFFAAVVTIALVCIAVFFITIFFIIISVLAVFIIAKYLWRQRQISRKGSKDVIEGEYTVEDEKKYHPGHTRLSDSQCLKDKGNAKGHSQ